MFRISRFINDTSFQMVYRNNELDIVNYDTINYMEDTKISINYYGKRLLIKGTNLTARKLLDNEILICGSIEEVLFN